MKSRLKFIFLAAGLLLASNAMAAMTIEECRARAQRAEDQTHGALAGAAGGAVGGAAVGVVLGRSTGAKRGAALGAAAGGLKNANNKREAYERTFEDCMRARDEELAREQAANQ